MPGAGPIAQLDASNYFDCTAITCTNPVEVAAALAPKRTDVEADIAKQGNYTVVYLLQLVRAEMVKGLLDGNSDIQIFSRQLSIAEHMGVVESIRHILDSVRGLLSYIRDPTNGLLVQLVKQIFGKKDDGHGALVDLTDEEGRQGAFVVAMGQRLRDFINGLIRNILATLKGESSGADYATLKEAFEDCNVTESVRDLIKKGIQMLEDTVLGDETLVGSPILSLIPQLMTDTVNTMMGPMDDFSMGLYFKVFYQLVGTACMACCFSWMVARHYELKRAKHYGIKPRNLGIPFLVDDDKCPGCCSSNKNKRSTTRFSNGSSQSVRLLPANE